MAHLTKKNIHSFLPAGWINKFFVNFREQLRARSEEFVEQILQAHFGYLISWIKEAERKLEKGNNISILNSLLKRNSA